MGGGKEDTCNNYKQFKACHIKFGHITNSMPEKVKEALPTMTSDRI